MVVLGHVQRYDLMVKQQVRDVLNSWFTCLYQVHIFVKGPIDRIFFTETIYVL